jgi:hypothetical protein
MKGFASSRVEMMGICIQVAPLCVRDEMESFLCRREVRSATPTSLNAFSESGGRADPAISSRMNIADSRNVCDAL